MTTGKPVVVQQLPDVLDLDRAQEFFRTFEPHLDTDRPCFVFDFSRLRHLDSVGVDLLLRCMEETMKRNGDLKLAAVSPGLAAILEMTRIDRLFEVYPNCNEAVASFHRFSTQVLDTSNGDRETVG